MERRRYAEARLENKIIKKQQQQQHPQRQTAFSPPTEHPINTTTALISTTSRCRKALGPAGAVYNGAEAEDIIITAPKIHLCVYNILMLCELMYNVYHFIVLSTMIY